MCFQAHTPVCQKGKGLHYESLGVSPESQLQQSVVCRETTPAQSPAAKTKQLEHRPPMNLRTEIALVGPRQRSPQVRQTPTASKCLGHAPHRTRTQRPQKMHSMVAAMLKNLLTPWRAAGDFCSAVVVLQVSKRHTLKLRCVPFTYTCTQNGRYGGYCTVCSVSCMYRGRTHLCTP